MKAISEVETSNFERRADARHPEIGHRGDGIVVRLQARPGTRLEAGVEMREAARERVLSQFAEPEPAPDFLRQPRGEPPRIAKVGDDLAGDLRDRCGPIDDLDMEGVARENHPESIVVRLRPRRTVHDLEGRCRYAKSR